MNKNPLLALVLLTVLPLAARAQRDKNSAGAKAERAVADIKAAKAENLAALKAAAGKNPRAVLTRGYGKESVTPADKPTLDQAREAVRIKREYWEEVAAALRAERENLKAAIKKAANTEEISALTKELGRLNKPFSVAMDVIEDVKKDDKYIEVWAQEASGTEVVGGESAAKMIQRKIALIKDSTK